MKKKLPWFLVCCVFVFCFLFSGYKLCSTLYNYEKAQATYQNLKEIQRTISNTSVTSEAVAEDDILLTPDPLTSELKKINPDYISWIKIDGTAIDYPIVQGSLETDYLHFGFERTKSSSGTLFVPQEQVGFQETNTVIYGHNMKDGSMFADLKKYTQNAFYASYPNITILYNGQTLNYVIFSVQILGTDETSIYTYGHPNGTLYPYVQQMYLASIYTTVEPPDSIHSIITLSTCYESTKRLIIQAYKEETPQ